MITIIKQYINLILVVILICVLAYTHFKAYQAGENHIKEINRDEIQKAVNEKNRIEKEQNEKYTTAQTGYAGALDELNRRLRDAEAMSRGKDMSVAGSNGTTGTMPRTSENTSRIIDTTEITAGIRQTSFYALSMQDTLQCSRLIEFVKLIK